MIGWEKHVKFRSIDFWVEYGYSQWLEISLLMLKLDNCAILRSYEAIIKLHLAAIS